MAPSLAYGGGIPLSALLRRGVLAIARNINADRRAAARRSHSAGADPPCRSPRSADQEVSDVIAAAASNGRDEAERAAARGRAQRQPRPGAADAWAARPRGQCCRARCSRMRRWKPSRRSSCRASPTGAASTSSTPGPVVARAHASLGPAEVADWCRAGAAAACRAGHARLEAWTVATGHRTWRTSTRPAARQIRDRDLLARPRRSACAPTSSCPLIARGPHAGAMAALSRVAARVQLTIARCELASGRARAGQRARRRRRAQP